MNIFGFGIIIGVNILVLVISVIIALVGFALISWGLIGKVIGIILFAGALGFITELVLHKDVGTTAGVSLPFLVSLLAAGFAAYRAYQKRDSRRPSFGGKERTFSRNGLVIGLILVVITFATLSYVSQGNWQNLLKLDERAAQQSYERSSDGVKRFMNQVLRSIDRELAR